MLFEVVISLVTLPVREVSRLYDTSLVYRSQRITVMIDCNNCVRVIVIFKGFIQANFIVTLTLLHSCRHVSLLTISFRNTVGDRLVY